MKQLFTFIAVALLVNTASATIHIVTCQNSPSHFLPLTVNAVVGDTVHWTWVAGNHIVGPVNSTYIPNGAPSWNGLIDASHHDLEYVVTVPGTYNYDCHPATPHGEAASIVVSSVTGIQQHNVTPNLSSAYPNPFSDKITIETPPADQVIIYNVLGEKINVFALKSGQTKLETDLGTLPEGLFFYSILKNGIVLETRKIIKK